MTCTFQSVILENKLSLWGGLLSLGFLQRALLKVTKEGGWMSCGETFAQKTHLSGPSEHPNTSVPPQLALACHEEKPLRHAEAELGGVM